MGQYIQAVRRVPEPQRKRLIIDAARPGASIEVIAPRGPLARMRGLLGADRLEAGRGLLLRAKQVHTIGMHFAIDAVYLSKECSVLRVETLEPGRIGPFVLTARWVLELAAGEARRLGLRPGARFQFGDAPRAG